jgi:predicted ribosome quality control (RQC) complex YloA/Tae2 family protein
MELEIYIDKSLEQNAGIYFEKAKKLRHKHEGAENALNETQRKLDSLNKNKSMAEMQQKNSSSEQKKRQKQWYEKFRWFYSSEGFLVIGGRDTTTNDIIVKKHTADGDFVFHTEMAGSPFVVVKGEGKTPGKKTMEEAANFCASCSRAWNLKVSYEEVYAIKPDQVKKELGLPKGTFMIYGKREYFRPEIGFAIAVKEGIVISGPISAISSQTSEFIKLVQGDEKKSDIAKIIKKRFNADLNEVMQMMPPGNCKIK